MPDGMIQGGLEFVYAAYGISWLMIIGYISSIYFRGRNG